MKRAGEWGSKHSNAQHIDSQSEPIFKRTLGRRGTRMKIFAMKNTQMRQNRGTELITKIEGKLKLTWNLSGSKLMKPESKKKSRLKEDELKCIRKIAYEM